MREIANLLFKILLLTFILLLLGVLVVKTILPRPLTQLELALIITLAASYGVMLAHLWHYGIRKRPKS